MSTALDYMRSRAIDPHIAADLGIKRGRNANELLFPNGRRRILDEGKVLQQRGRPLQGWWIEPPTTPACWNVVLVCEGESDALAARSALPATPKQTGLDALPIYCLPGTGYPLARFCDEMTSTPVREVLLALDPDSAGEGFVDEAFPLLIERGIRPVRVEVPEPDLAGWLARCAPVVRGRHLASLLIDCEAAAPTLTSLTARREAAELRREADRIEAAA